jgi:hypothetical protein
MDKLELLYDHYKDTFQIIQKLEEKRNKLFIITGIIISLFFIITISPEQTIPVIQNTIKQYTKINIQIHFAVIQSVLWLFLLYSLTYYYKLTIDVDRHYPYLHQLEENIESLIQTTFSREGKSYLENYPLLNNICYYCFIYFFPIIYLSCIIVKAISEFKVLGYYTNFDTVIAILCSILIIMFLFKDVHFRKS